MSTSNNVGTLLQENATCLYVPSYAPKIFKFSSPSPFGRNKIQFHALGRGPMTIRRLSGALCKYANDQLNMVPWNQQHKGM